MIKALNLPQMSSAKPRTGLNSVGDLIPRLIRHYELLAEFRNEKSVVLDRAGDLSTGSARKRNSVSKQQSFSWYEN